MSTRFTNGLLYIMLHQTILNVYTRSYRMHDYISIPSQSVHKFDIYDDGMLHGIKVALSRRGSKAGTDERLRTSDTLLCELERWFPRLQKALVENEKLWYSVGHNICTVSKTAQEIYDEEDVMQYTLDMLHAAGEAILHPADTEGRMEKRHACMSDLCAFNERVKEIRRLHNECLCAVRNKEYYQGKVEGLRMGERRKSRVGERDVERRLRNEDKLKGCLCEMNLKTDCMMDCVCEVVDRSERVLKNVLESYVKSQDFYFGRNQMPPVLDMLKAHGSPRGVNGMEVGQGGDRLHDVVDGGKDVGRSGDGWYPVAGGELYGSIYMYGEDLKLGHVTDGSVLSERGDGEGGGGSVYATP